MKKALMLGLFGLLIVTLFQANALQLLVHVNDSSSNISGATVFVYNNSDVAQNLTNTTNSTGYAHFNFSEGNYTINVTNTGYYLSSSEFNLSNDSIVNFTLTADSVDPVVSLESPAPGALLTAFSQNLTFNVTDDLATSLNCSLYINGSVNQTNLSVTTSTPTKFALTFAEENYNWSVSCSDDQNNEHSASRLLSVRVAPVFSFFSVSDSIIKNNTVFYVILTSDETLNQTPVLTVNGTAANLQSNGSNSFMFNLTINSSLISEGNITVNVSGYDLFGTYGSNTRTIITDYTNPTINTANLSDNYTRNNTQVVVTINATDANNISSIMAGSTSLTNQSGNIWNGTITLTDSSTNVTITVNDTANNIVTTSINYTIDANTPTLNISNSPANNYLTNTTQLTFNWTSSDVEEATINCSLIINGATNYTSLGNGSFESIVNFSSGNYVYSISCFDSADNTNTSTNRSFSIDNNHNPELNISLSDNNTQNNTQVTLSVVAISYSNITSMNFTYDGTSTDLNLSSGTYKSGTWSTTITLSDNTSGLRVYAVDYYNDTNNGLVNYTIDDIAPTTNVSGMNATNTSSGSILLEWANDDPSYLHRVYRKTSNYTENATEGTLIGTANAGATSYEDNTTLHGTNYFYAVMSIDEASNYNISIYAEANNTATDTIIPKSPTSLNITLLSNNALGLTWDAVSEDINGNPESGTIRYYIYRSSSQSWNTSKSPTYNVTGTTLQENYSGISGNISNNTYYYLVTSRDAAGNENRSNGTANANGTVGNSCTSNYVFEAWSSCSSAGLRERDGERYCFGLDYDDNIQEKTQTDSCTVSENADQSDNSGGDDDNTETSSLLATWNNVAAGELITYAVIKEDFGLRKILFKLKKAEAYVSLKLIAHSGRPSSTDTMPVSKIFKFFEVDTSGFDLDEATIEFFVEKSWLINEGVDEDDIVLWHFTELAEWVKEPTNKVGEDGTLMIYNSTIDSFSVFAIGTSKITQNTTNVTANPSINEDSENDDITTSDDDTTESDNNATTTEGSDEAAEGNTWPLIVMLIIIVLAGGTIAYLNYYKGRAPPFVRKLLEKFNLYKEAKRREVPETEEEALKKYNKEKDRILKF